MEHTRLSLKSGGATPPSVKLCTRCGIEPVGIRKWGVCLKCYGRLRREGVIPRKNPQKNVPLEVRREKLRKRFGPEFLRDLHALQDIPYFGLSDMARKHGITREYARLIFLDIFGIPYSSVRKNKSARVEDGGKNHDCPSDPREWIKMHLTHKSMQQSARTLLLVLDRCESFGMEVRSCSKKMSGLIVNGHKVGVRSVGGLHSGKKAYFRANLRENHRGHFDFILLYNWSDDLFYVFPKSFYSERKAIFIPTGEKETECSKRISRFRGAWHLLE